MDAVEARAASSRRWALVAVILGSGAVFLDSTVVNVALPRIGRDLPALSLGVLEGQSYVYSGYLLALSALLIPAGALSDRLGRRRVYGFGLVAFGAASLLCGLAPNLEFLVAARVLQGVAGAVMVPGSLALIRSTFPASEQGRAIGTWSGASAGTTLLGPLVGGVLVDTISWRAAFLVNLPVLAVALFLLLRHATESRGGAARIDVVGAVLAAVAVGGLSFGTIFGQQHGWDRPAPWVGLGAGAAAALALPWWLLHAEAPLVPPALFRVRDFTVVNIATLLVYGALYLSGYYTALFLQGVLGYTAAAAGVAGLPMGVLLALLSNRFGKLSDRVGPRPLMAAGPVLMAAGVLWLVRAPGASAPWRLALDRPETWAPSTGYLVDVLPAWIVFGAGLAMLVAPLTAALMRSAPESEAGVASAFNNAISRVGPQLAGAVLFVAVTAVFRAEAGRAGGAAAAALSPFNLPADVPGGLYGPVAAAARAASVDAFHLAAAVCAVLLLAGAAVSWFGLRPGGRASPAPAV